MSIHCFWEYTSQHFPYQWKASNWSVISYNCSFALSSFVMSTSVMHVGTAPIFTESGRCCLRLGCRQVAFLNQNHCTWSGLSAFQLDILPIARFSSLSVILTFSCFGVSLSSLSPSSTIRNLYCAPLVQTVTCSKPQLIPLELVPPSAHSSSHQILCKTASDNFWTCCSGGIVGSFGCIDGSLL